MERYTFFDHTADAKYHAFGKSLEEAFTNAALAMYSIIIDEGKVIARMTKSVTIHGKDLKALLYNFLEELLVLLDSEFFLLARIDSIQIHRMGDKYVLQAVLKGDQATENYETHAHVKAVTYNEMDIKEEKGVFMVQVVLDL